MDNLRSSRIFQRPKPLYTLGVMGILIKMADKIKNKYVAIDLDNTIAKYDGWRGLDHIGEPIEGVREQIDRLVEAGFKIIIHTCRHLKSLEVINDYLHFNGIAYHYVNYNPEQPDTAGGLKVFADWYIDDRTPTFVSVEDSVNKIFERL